jgi:hypothetical protein
MAWYVFALVDEVPSGAPAKGLTGALSLRKLAGAFAVVERRADVPPVGFGTLKKHQDVVSRLATHVPAILPVRFGTLMASPDLEEALAERDEEIAEAFDLVRGRVQFTWRAAGKSGSAVRGARRKDEQPASGTAYLRQAARAARPAAPAAFRPLRSSLARLAVRERYQPGTATMPDTVYHLVDKSDQGRYAAAAATLGRTTRLLAVTGPFAPFAFAPEIL